MIYIEELVGPGAVNTIPPVTFDAFRSRGPRASSGGSGVCRRHDGRAAFQWLHDLTETSYRAFFESHTLPEKVTRETMTGNELLTERPARKALEAAHYDGVRGSARVEAVRG